MNNFKRILETLSNVEIEDHGFDISITIYEVYLMKEDCNDICIIKFFKKEDAIKYIERMKNKEDKYYWMKHLVWFNE